MSVAYAEALLDAHVHYHDGFCRRTFLDAAWRNLSAGEEQLRLTGTMETDSAARMPTDPPAARTADGRSDAVAKALMFTESNGVDIFGELADEAVPTPGSGLAPTAGGTVPDEPGSPNSSPSGPPRSASGGWGFRATEEGNSLWAMRAADGARMLIIAGHQLVTREGLEVLALGCRPGLPDGSGLREARDAVIEEGGIAVVPWGFGKWWFARGRLLRALLEADSPGRWFLGDNAGRPRLSRRPELFDRAAGRGVFVLPGSDPLPLAGQDSKPGRCGFHLEAQIDALRPAESVLGAVRSMDRQPRTFGQYEGLADFAREQLAMQLRKRRALPGGKEATP